MGDQYIKNLLGHEEQIVLETRQHWFEVVRRILPELATILFAIILISITLVKWTDNPHFAWAYLLILIPLISLGRDILIWNNHKYIVTTRRVIQIFGIFSKNVTDSSLEKVNDVKMVQSFWGRMFGFGDIEILTASELGINRFTHIDRPIQFKTAMLNAKQKMESVDKGFVSEPVNLPAVLAQLNELRAKGILSEEDYHKTVKNLVSGEKK